MTNRDSSLPNGNLTPNGTTNMFDIPEAEYQQLQTERAYAKFNNPKRRDRSDDEGREP